MADVPDAAYKVVDSIEACLAAVEDLAKESVIAVDVEGVHLGKEGPLTLLQVAKLDGFVYLFNVFAEPKLFDDGLLRSILENKSIVKVFHACSRDSAALKCQFNVMLENVFDIQAAQYVVEKYQGRQLPSHLKLEDLCGLYTDVSSLKDKEIVQEKWYKTEGSYWAKKTLTQEMIDYACADVRVMIPEVYEKLKKIIEDGKLQKNFEQKTAYELRFRWDEKVRNDEKEENMATVKRLLRGFASKYSGSSSLSDITDDDLNALKQIRIQEVSEFSSVVKKLKNEYITTEIDKIEEEIKEKGDNFVPRTSHFGIVGSGNNSTDLVLKMKAKKISAKLDEMLKSNLSIMYDETTPAHFLSEDERRFMRRLPPSTGTSSLVKPVLRHLYQVSIAADVKEIETLRLQFLREGRRFKLSDADHRKFKYFISCKTIPSNLSMAARRFLTELQDAGIVADPRRRRSFRSFSDFDFQDYLW